MTTQIMFKIDEKLKRAIQKKAKKDGLTLSDFYKFATKSYVDGKISVGIVADIEEESWDDYTPETFTAYKEGLRDFKEGKFFRAR